MKIRYFSINFITLRTIKAYSHIILDISGRFSKDKATSDENVKVRRKALTALLHGAQFAAIPLVNLFFGPARTVVIDVMSLLTALLT